ncbi:exocyst complex component EXO70B1-like [Salvia hispanica]|uniref:exocyst complex component EXO70B1-like n=1 Tax=Salvia hispanica TaxID=49212 RepID=UPI002009763A|nr:exocyst complex component EXO70B1-like [Salvia hispanica]
MDSQENEHTNEEEPPPPLSSPLPPDLSTISSEIDQYISSQESLPPDAPTIIEKFLMLVEEEMEPFDSTDAPLKWTRLKEEDASWFLRTTNRVSSLVKLLAEFRSDYKYAYTINRAGSVLHRAMSYLEGEFKAILEDHSKSPGSTADLTRVCSAMLRGGYQDECCHVYFIVRRNALEEKIVQQGLENVSIDDIHNKPWESLERDIEVWIMKFTSFAKDEFPPERNLLDSVFAGDSDSSIPEILLSALTCGITKHILKFAEAVALTHRSPDKLFKYLTIYEAVRDVVAGIGALLAQGVAPELKNEALMIRSHLGEAMISILTELENSIKNDHGKNPVPGGAVHPITTYIMNYLEFTAMYKDSLEQVYLEHQRLEATIAAAAAASTVDAEGVVVSPFQAQILKIMDLLLSNLEDKSKFYKDTSLTSIFMMNNGRYMLKKIKKSGGLHSLLAETWYRKMSSDLRTYHKGYQRETWGKLLGFLNPEGLTGNNKHVKPLLKERFKNFNALFDDIRKTQTSWVISDEQLQSELRVSISNMVVPAYRSFLARYSQIFSSGRQTEKYIKHQPDDVETAIEGLFSGTPATSGKRKL